MLTVIDQYYYYYLILMLIIIYFYIIIIILLSSHINIGLILMIILISLFLLCWCFHWYIIGLLQLYNSFFWYCLWIYLSAVKSCKTLWRMVANMLIIPNYNAKPHSILCDRQFCILYIGLRATLNPFLLLSAKESTCSWLFFYPTFISFLVLQHFTLSLEQYSRKDTRLFSIASQVWHLQNRQFLPFILYLRLHGMLYMIILHLKNTK